MEDRLIKGQTSSLDLIEDGKIDQRKLDQVVIRVTPQGTVNSADLAAMRSAIGENEMAQDNLGALLKYARKSIDEICEEYKDDGVMPAVELEYAGATFIFMRS